MRAYGGSSDKMGSAPAEPGQGGFGKGDGFPKYLPPPYQVANIIPATAAIVTVHSHPIAHGARSNTKRPVTSRRIAISIMITISGTATTPLMTADQNSALT